MPYINARYQRSGTLWEERYKSSLIQSDAYLLACMRYIELNPVRAGMCTDPAHYRWSSYRANALQDITPWPWLAPHPLFATLGATAYRTLFDQVLDEKTIADIRLALNQTQPLGNNRFFDSIEEVTGQRREAKPRGRPRKMAGEEAASVDANQLGLPSVLNRA